MTRNSFFSPLFGRLLVTRIRLTRKGALALPSNCLTELSSIITDRSSSSGWRACTAKLHHARERKSILSACAFEGVGLSVKSIYSTSKGHLAWNRYITLSVHIYLTRHAKSSSYQCYRYGFSRPIYIEFRMELYMLDCWFRSMTSWGTNFTP